MGKHKLFRSTNKWLDTVMCKHLCYYMLNNLLGKKRKRHLVNTTQLHMHM